jgi:hypothetical protein
MRLQGRVNSTLSPHTEDCASSLLEAFRQSADEPFMKAEWRCLSAKYAHKVSFFRLAF